ncbi:sensor histidine kinase [Pigmentiphaga kullae]|uniref:histidine kinase n=1 Tax=Pigmentiphaga kullae TaxID=151784 RepID=A0A4Q7NMZ0_9BURK|nr:HAMP domain-containing sensor histidine kinase [Pigmentiphaga kullae]RZS86581.1 signal transduction histidine kinase [Pigmentiphaga kullae]
MNRSISTRIQWLVALVSAFCLTTVVLVSLLAHDGVERAMLGTDLMQTQEALVSAASRNVPMQWSAPGMLALYVPTGTVDQVAVPELFRGLTAPFSDDVSVDGKTYLAAISQVDGGMFYIARDITLFENEMRLMERAVWGVSVLILIVALVLTRIGVVRLVRPIRVLATLIDRTKPSASIDRVPTEFHDSALNSIAENFNLFLRELEAYIDRERTLLRLASHELRTPIAVVTGALNVMRDRGALGEADLRTLTRAQRAAQEMAGNLEVVLKAGRREEIPTREERFSVSELLNEALLDLTSVDSSVARISLIEKNAVTALADRTLVKMLLLNILQNALRHTAGAVEVVVTSSFLEVRDQGKGLDGSRLDLLAGSGADDLWNKRQSSGLGLIVVSILAERLGWPIRVSRRRPEGTAIQLVFAESIVNVLPVSL